ncbi:hypothetical protein IQ269_23995 [Tychonema sp. LEGE 07199]|uniref:hypothetical protein n=1 Tax=unclassified Tychonema TaxID=2642144 RepID=UPI00187FBF5F|nr:MULTISPECIES: hypothetical protein [unclassified Tychonema]MBE9123775.1 hypothetical protein [Tychonema sp. LEGE 07199]MBE9133311.1 hypothetical protein [Tychonema sp. LEGE 07196]
MAFIRSHFLKLSANPERTSSQKPGFLRKSFSVTRRLDKNAVSLVLASNPCLADAWLRDRQLR